MIRLSLLAGSATLAVLLATVHTAAQDLPGFAVRDSAGIRIAESTRPAWEAGQGWTVGDTAMLRIGMGRRGAVPFRLPDGRLAIATLGWLHTYHPDGIRSDSAKLEDEEHEWIGWMGTGAGDSLMAYTRMSRIYVFAPDGRIARRANVAGVIRNWPDAVGRFSDGTLLLDGGHPINQTDTVPRRYVLRYVMVDPRGAHVGVWGDLPDVARMGLYEVPFSSEILLTMRGDDVLLGDNRTFEYTVATRAGDLRRIVRRPFAPLRVHQADVEAWNAGQELKVQDPSPALRRLIEQRRADLRRVPAAGFYPAYADLRADPGGNVWARESRRLGDPERSWSVFDPEGRWLGAVRLPDDFALYQVGADWVMGTRKDAAGETSVLVFPLRRTTGGQAAGEQPAAP